MAVLFSLFHLTFFKRSAVALREALAGKSSPMTIQTFLRRGCVVFFLFFLLLQSHVCFAATPFPRYPVIENNVRFWETIYGRYSTSQAVVHDSYNLGIVYEVIPIFNHRIPGASKLNKPFYKGIKKKYSTILTKLAEGIAPVTAEEKRIAALFGNVNRKRFKKAANSVRIQVGQKDRFLQGVIRSGAYMAEIKSILKRQGIPTDLAYLPHVESSFNLKAYSKAGASGIWQFTRSTGKRFLTINYALDERQDPILASHAAAKFLKNNYRLLESWPLALTAYNYGPSGMLRAKKAHSRYEDIFLHYAQGHFKFASRNFYSEFLAAKRVAKRLERDPDIRLDKPLRTVGFPLPGYIAALDLCKHFNISLDTLKKLNPALRRPVLRGDKFIPKGYTLQLPANARQKALLSTVPKRIFHKKQKPTQFYRVKKGDTAGKVARAHKVSLTALRKANALERNSAIFVGQNLRIPGITDKTGKTITIISTQQKIKLPTSDINIYGTSTSTRTRTSTSTSTEILPTLADSKKNKPAWKKVQTARSVVMGDLSVHINGGTKNPRLGTVTIQPEESLELIADWLEIDSNALRTLNKLSPARQLHPDEKLQILLSRVSAKRFEERRFDYHLETEEDFFNVYTIVGVNSYRVKRGDTIWEICNNKFDLPLWLLKKYNATLDFSSLRSSQWLTIPIIKAI